MVGKGEPCWADWPHHYVLLCYDVSCHVTSCYVMSCHAMFQAGPCGLIILLLSQRQAHTPGPLTLPATITTSVRTTRRLNSIIWRLYLGPVHSQRAECKSPGPGSITHSRGLLLPALSHCYSPTPKKSRGGQGASDHHPSS